MKHYFFTITYDVVFTASSEESAYDMLENAIPKQDEFHEDVSDANIELTEIQEDLSKTGVA
jgi:hypothetical protein